MVQMLKQKGIDWPVVSEKEMAEIISFIYYLKLFDRPGDAAAGKAAFEDKKCSSCHSLGRQQFSLRKFGSYVSPVYLAEAMWNAGPAMHTAQRARGIAMPLFRGREMADVQAFIRSETAAGHGKTHYLPLPDLSRGAALFASKGCSSCHRPGGSSGPDLSRAPLRKSISEICGVLWNHSFAMQAKMTANGGGFPKLQKNELADILAYIYFLHFSRDEGDASRGERVFAGKGCGNCHGAGLAKRQAPSLTAGGVNYDMLRLATSMWNHAPIMYESMESEIMRWIKLDPNDMQDLSKFLRNPK
jgi:mono/diheme cytochrome c family protein